VEFLGGFAPLGNTVADFLFVFCLEDVHAEIGSLGSISHFWHSLFSSA
jgi:hypothetical protein